MNLDNDGFFKGSLEFFKDAKKVVAGPVDRRADPFGIIDRAGRKLGPGAFYLYLVLI